MRIEFSPPDITQLEIDEVVDTLKSGWITTGPKTKKLEQELSVFTNTDKTVCLNSATAAMELTLRLLGVGAGDEVITCAYTYTASASVIHHVGAKIVLVDCNKEDKFMDLDALENAITEKTKVIIPVDLAGKPCKYDEIFEIVERKKSLFKPNNKLQEKIGRVIVMADAAHSLGAVYKGKPSGSIADFTCFSFHAVKNFTVAEGGSVTWNRNLGLNDDEVYREFQLLSLHGQSKDALSKTKLGSWEYDIVAPNYKCNLTDIASGIGLAQLKRYPSLLKRRFEIVERYNKGFEGTRIKPFIHFEEDRKSCCHLYIVNIEGASEEDRNEIIVKMAERGIATNVHYKPLPMHTAYKNLGFDIKDYPNAFDNYKSEITLPLHTLLTDEQVDYIIENLKALV
ncbi:DegT/DnrJ/EryC1/StrS aminotransferase family protein [Parvimonas micra]|uniref:Capsular biosynthesis protein n=2 Tax=Parvimonas micra TaxID=33033 RepID=A0A0B4S3P0_9FIRM|nr:DegT/DnrJ/EryC1/StrS family aminotransferase [Parvimonas micra]AIZ37189.1 capsular biosynthesis protein [Parvimonas micra]EDP24095.1 DegT/DnrJ/EryC1/StrS aminotransferase family protein [Parvimonas micra ATCC 33270]MBF1307188.1 DegT/DnrJ/EryC1/StrS family aminotransferase [Parvimonas micra]MEB3029192.1 DegT/DnrJ/EryC1/StrS family aminotransferase [Parvimonas micra]MEB3060398.1 DegT/DnrJ/EryC1/StrS family aminotransferase [Parvimonas micra]